MRFSLAIIVSTFLMLAGCGSPTSSSAPQEPVSETQPDTVAASLIIDVRSKEEWDAGHLEQAVHIPHTEIADRIGEHTADKNRKIIVYCKVGGRAGIAKESLEKAGFANVENAGGFADVKTRFGE